MSASEATHVYTGLYECLASGVLTLWVFVSAWRLRRLVAARNGRGQEAKP